MYSCTKLNSEINLKGIDKSIRKDNREVNCTIWNNPNCTKVLIIAPAIGVSRRFYKTIATYFFDLSYSVISLDYYGMVRHKKLEEEKISLCDWGFKDIDSIITYATKKFPKQELYFLGHSIAGQVFPLAKSSNAIKAAFFVASQNVSSSNWSGFPKFKVTIFWRMVIPFCIRAFGHLPAKAYGGKHDLHKSIAVEWAKLGRSKQGVLGHVPKAPSRYGELKVPTKFLSFSDDKMLAPFKSVKRLYDSYGTPFKEHVHIHPGEIGMKSIGHFRFFKKQCKFLWPEIDSWFKHVDNNVDYS
ncbi:alpha/beta hydrolase family protein [Flagellimonas sp. 2504JD1-5]